MKTIDCVIVAWEQRGKHVNIKVQPLVGETLHLKLETQKVNINYLNNYNRELANLKYGGRKRLKEITIDGFGERDQVIYRR